MCQLQSEGLIIANSISVSGTIDSMGDTVFQPSDTISATHLTGFAVCKPDVRFVNVIRNVELVCKNLHIHFAGI